VVAQKCDYSAALSRGLALERSKQRQAFDFLVAAVENVSYLDEDGRAAAPTALIVKAGQPQHPLEGSAVAVQISNGNYALRHRQS